MRYNLIESMCRRKVGASPIIELPDEEMGLCEQVVAFFDLLKRLPVVSASREFFAQPLKGFNGFLNGIGVSFDPFRPFHLAFSHTEGGIGCKDMGAMQFEEMVELDDGFRIFLFFEVGFSSLHNDVGIVVFFDRIADENVFVCAS